MKIDEAPIKKIIAKEYIKMPDFQKEFVPFLNTPWLKVSNYFKIPMFYKKIQIQEDQPTFYIAKCLVCGDIFHTEKHKINLFRILF